MTKKQPSPTVATKPVPCGCGGRSVRGLFCHKCDLRLQTDARECPGPDPKSLDGICHGKPEWGPWYCSRCNRQPDDSERRCLYGDLRSMLPGNADYLRILRKRLGAADAAALDCLTHYACELFGRRPFTEAIFADLDPWLRIKCPAVDNEYVQLRLEDTGQADEYGLTLLEVAGLLEAEVSSRIRTKRQQEGDPLDAISEAILAIIRAGKGRGLTGKEIVRKLEAKQFQVEESTLRRHHFGKLKAHGIENRRSRGGYYDANASP
jgi:hypothetical protein